MPPRGLDPSGIVLVDKPAGPSSFAIVRQLRDRTGARTGHAGTLDPFATGLLLVLSGRATKLASRFVGLDKRYLADLDLSARTTTGDPEGEVVELLEPLAAEELERRRAGHRGAVGLPNTVAEAVSIGGERAQRLTPRGGAGATHVHARRGAGAARHPADNSLRTGGGRDVSSPRFPRRQSVSRVRAKPKPADRRRGSGL